MKVRNSILVILNSCLIFSCLLSYSFAQTIIHVPADFQTIQEAIDTATEIDTIEITSGTYPEILTIDKHTFLKGDNIYLNGGAISINSGKNLLFNGEFNIDGYVAIKNGEYGIGTFFRKGQLSILDYVRIHYIFPYEIYGSISIPLSGEKADVFEIYHLSFYDESSRSSITIEDPNSLLIPGHGYYISPSQGSFPTYLYGDVVLEDVPIEIQCSGQISDRYGRNYLGNPYAAYLHWDLFEKPENMGHAIYFLPEDTSTNGVKDLFYVNGIGNTLPFILPMKGFFIIYTDISTNSSLNFSQEYCIIPDHESYFINDKDDLLNLGINGNGSSDETFIHFNENATKEFDLKYDALKLRMTPFNSVILYTKDFKEQTYAVNSMPEIDMLRLCVDSDMPGEYTIKAIDISNFNNVVIQDLKTGDVIDLLTYDYVFDFEEDDPVDRFIIHFTPICPPMPTYELDVYAYGDEINVIIPQDTNDYYIWIRDVFAKEIYQKSKLRSTLTKFQVEMSNCYFVRILINDTEIVNYSVCTDAFQIGKSENNFNLFPNPFYDKISIMPVKHQDEEVLLIIHDFHGKKTKSIKLGNIPHNLSFDYLNSGIYFFTFKDINSNILEIKKVIKK